MNLAWVLVFLAAAVPVLAGVLWRRRKVAPQDETWRDSDRSAIEVPAEDDFPTLEFPPVVVDEPSEHQRPSWQGQSGYDQGHYERSRTFTEVRAESVRPTEVSGHRSGSVTAGTGPVASGDPGPVLGAMNGRIRIYPADPQPMATTSGQRPIEAKAEWPSRLVPFGDFRDPLPRDGLFVRRNNAYGTKATTDIADLVDQGVLIDQTQIRFDDFVASDLSGIPTPPSGEAVEVSHGVRAVEKEFRAKPSTTHLVEVALRAGDVEREPRQRPESLPVNFVFVIDTSSSMEGAKLHTVRTAIRELYARLRDSDILGIVTFDTQVRTVLKATPKSDVPAVLLDDVVAGLEARGATDINMGVLFGIDEIARHSGGRSDLVNCLYLFSDGDPTSGERDWITIRRTVADRVRGDITLSCFGFGADARMRELEALAGVTGGFCTLVTGLDDVRLHLTEDLARREHLAAINVQLQLRLDAAVTGWHLYGHDLVTDPSARARVEQDVATAKHRARDDHGVESLPDIVTADEGIRIFAPDLASGETYWVVLEVEAPAGWKSFGHAAVQYVDVVARANRRHDVELTAGTIAPETVFAHAVGLRTSEIVFYALEDLYQDDREAARARLSRHVETLRAAHALSPSPQFHSDQVTLRKLASLVHNLGLVRAWTDSGGGGSGTIFALNRLGQSRSGFARGRFAQP
ncbi:VWA domain-containing protein [Lentzea sp. NPDC058436]|uniref:VWA domain-containing protein n=1 Tax=Lentzea sp. NPDC058436 TaxID=3346499 RepID=UPI003663151A